MNNAQLRNTLPPEDQQAEFLLCAKFHDEIHDNDRGYVTTQWTPLHVLESIEDPYAGLAGCVKACILEGQAFIGRSAKARAQQLLKKRRSVLLKKRRSLCDD